jgi:TP901 family phage tail tape measure protein
MVTDFITLGGDAQPLLHALQQGVAAWAQYTEAQRKNVEVAATLNTAGKVQNATITAQYNELVKLVQQLSRTKEGNIQVANSIKISTAALKERERAGQRVLEQMRAEARQQQEQRNLAAQRARDVRAEAQATQSRARRARGIIGAPERGRTADASRDEILRVQEAKNALIDLARTNKITGTQLKRIWRDTSRGIIRPYEGAMSRAQSLVIGVRRSVDNLGAAHRKQAAAALRAARARAAAAERARLAEERARQNAERTTRAMRTQNQAQVQSLITWRSIVRIATIQVLHQWVSRLTGAFRQGVVQAIEYQKRIAEIQTILQTARISTARWATELQRVSDEWGLDLLDTAEAAYQTLSNQVADGADSLEFLAKAARFAVTTVASQEDAVNLLTAALNAFNLQAVETDKVAASFFKTIELGRVRASEMANALGRTAVPAAQLGITLNELQTAYTVATIRGVKFTEASTLIRNVILKLIRPTDNMKTLLREWGVDSGEAAIKTFGFAGVLAKLEEATQGSSTELGNLFGRIRAITGAMLFAGRGLQQFGTSLDQVTKSTDSYEKASRLVLQNQGKRLEIEINKIRTFFIKDVGSNLITTIGDWTDGFTSLADVIKQTLLTLLDFGKALALVVGAQQVFKILRLVAAVRSLQDIITGAGIAMTKLVTKTALLSAAGIFAVATALTLIIYLLRRSREEIETVNQLQARTSQEEIDRLRDQSAEEQRLLVERTRAVEKHIRAKAKLYLQDTANYIQNIEKQLANQIKVLDEGIDFTKNTFEEIELLVKKNVKVVQDEYSKLIAAAKKYENAAKRQLEQLTKSRQKVASDVVQLRLELIDTRQLEKEFEQSLERLKKLRDAALQRGDFTLAFTAGRRIEALTISRREELARRRGQQMLILTQHARELQKLQQEAARTGDIKAFENYSKELVKIVAQRQTLAEQGASEITRQQLVTIEIKNRLAVYRREATLRKQLAEDEKARATAARAEAAEIEKKLRVQKLLQIELQAIFSKIIDFDAKELLEAETEDELTSIMQARVKLMQEALIVADKLGVRQQLHARLEGRAQEERRAEFTRREVLEAEFERNRLLVSEKARKQESANALDALQERKAAIEARRQELVLAAAFTKLIPVKATITEDIRLRGDALMPFDKAIAEERLAERRAIPEPGMIGRLLQAGAIARAAFTQLPAEEIHQTSLVLDLLLKKWDDLGTLSIDQLKNIQRQLIKAKASAIDFTDPIQTAIAGIKQRDIAPAQKLLETVTFFINEIGTRTAHLEGIQTQQGESFITSLIKTRELTLQYASSLHEIEIAAEKTIRPITDAAAANERLADALERISELNVEHADAMTQLGSLTAGGFRVAPGGNVLSEPSPIIEESKTATQELTKAINRLTDNILTIPLRGNITQRSGGGTTDSQLAMLTPGEMVINRASTSKYYKELLAINSNRFARGYQGGGIVRGEGVSKAVPLLTGALSPDSISSGDTVDVGGIKIQVTEAQAGQMTAQRLNSILNRGLRTGQIKLRSK